MTGTVMPIKGEGSEPETGGFASIWIGDREFSATEVRSALTASASEPVTLPDDLFSHRDAWRRGLVILRDTAEYDPPIDDKAYWQHELDVFDRVFSALSASPVPASEPEPVADAVDAERIHEVMDEEGQNGAACGWQPCTGCHETNEGVETGLYPYSKAFGCHVGAGCAECGGIGVIWHHYSATALADMQADTPELVPTPTHKLDNRSPLDHLKSVRDEIERELDTAVAGTRGENFEAGEQYGFRRSLDRIEFAIAAIQDADVSAVPTPDGAVEALRKALEPFAKIADEYADQEDDDFQVWKDFDVLGATLPLKHFRAARTALETPWQKPGRAAQAQAGEKPDFPADEQSGETSHGALHSKIVRAIMYHVVDGEPETPEELADEILRLTAHPADGWREPFDNLSHIVQYRRADGSQRWTTMAAFDSERVAEKYRNDCSSTSTPWEYRVIAAPAAKPEGE